MRTLELGKHRQARIWIGELPGLACSSIKTLTHTITAERESQNGLRLAAIEVFAHVGPRSMYGLLGGHWKPHANTQLNIQVEISAANERLFTNSLALNDEVRVGLPIEYGNAVLTGVKAAKIELAALTAGELSIDCAAHGAIGSCEAVYKHLATTLVKLFNLTNSEPSNEELMNLFPPKFN